MVVCFGSNEWLTVLYIIINKTAVTMAPAGNLFRSLYAEFQLAITLRVGWFCQMLKCGRRADAELRNGTLTLNRGIAK